MIIDRCNDRVWNISQPNWWVLFDSNCNDRYNLVRTFLLLSWWVLFDRDTVEPIVLIKYEIFFTPRLFSYCVAVSRSIGIDRNNWVRNILPLNWVGAFILFNLSTTVYIALETSLQCVNVLFDSSVYLVASVTKCSSLSIYT